MMQSEAVTEAVSGVPGEGERRPMSKCREAETETGGSPASGIAVSPGMALGIEGTATAELQITQSMRPMATLAAMREAARMQKPAATWEMARMRKPAAGRDPTRHESESRTQQEAARMQKPAATWERLTCLYASPPRWMRP
jgi:hypothetical protein